MITMRYTNYRNEVSTRRIQPVCIWFGRTLYHPEDQWLLSAYDLDKKVNRDFALEHCDFTPKTEEGEDATKSSEE